MRINPRFPNAFSIPRIAAVLSLVSAAISLAFYSFAANPPGRALSAKTARLAPDALTAPTVLHFHGNPDDMGGDPPTPCAGSAPADIVNCLGPFLKPEATLFAGPAATWNANSALNQNTERSTVDPNWVWNLTAPVTLKGDMVINFWGTCGACSPALFDAEWDITLWADGVNVFTTRIVGPTPAAPNVPSFLSATVNIPTSITANSRLVLVIDPAFADTQANTKIYYDSAMDCPGAPIGSGPCDSTVTMPVVDPNAVPALSINDVGAAEGDSGTKTFAFTVSLSAAAPAGGITFNIATQDNTATTADNDYVGKSSTGQTIPEGQQTYTFNVTVNGDTVEESNQTFFVNVTNVSAGATVADVQGVGTILNDDSSTPLGAPRYFNYYSPFADFAGEPSIGSNWGSETNSTNNNINGTTNSIPNGGHSHYYGGFFDYMLKASWDDCPSPANPNFEKRPVLLAGTPRAFGDPILFTDNHTPGQHARTFVSQLEGLTPAGSTTDITDDDGASFHPSEGSGLPSHIDHQTFGGGPFRTNSVPPPPPHPTYPNAIYYCSQNVSDAACSLSIDGGVTFGPAVPIYTVADCAGLHGHLKVAPDGTVYVPNKACAVNGVPLLLGGNAAVVVSEDNGITWDIRPVPDDKGGQSAGEWDSSVGVATNGTIYLGYQAINNHARIAVSHDRGLTWSQSVDVGVPSASVKVDDVDANGIENMVFPEVVAGDPNRAAFAFYGSDKSDAEGGDHSGGADNDPNLFSGVWYQYIASTFDGGATWTTVNSTPNDPIQRGSICHDSTCRNLLDFFDIQVDKQGRVLVAGQDGCIGGCVNGPPNSFTAQAFITRQSGGKRLFAAFDPAEPHRPGAPKVTGSANGAGTIINLSWPVPDHGGATITAYNIYRKFGGGAFNHIATVTNNSFTDIAFTSPASENSYRVTAVNSQGEGPYCGTVLPVIGGATPCIEPGITVVDDTNADGSDNDVEQNMPPDGSVNVRLLRMAEPFLGNGVKKLVFTLQVAPSLLTNPPPNSQWIIVWNRIGGVAADGSDRRYVAMVSDDAGNLTFDYGDFGPALPLDGSIPPPNANAPTKLGEADSGTYDMATGVIRIVLSTSKAENILAGQTLAALNVRTYFNRPDYPDFQRSQNNASDITGNGNYTLVGNDLPPPGCLLNQLPTAVLDGSPTSGNSPLVVNFNASGSTDPDPGDSISAYIFTFGDGTPDVEQPGPTLGHTYTCPGPPTSQSTCNFFASLRVKDQSGALSANTAVVPIQVKAATPPAPTPTPTPAATPSPNPTPTPAPTATPTASPTPTPTPAQLLNISTRAQVLTGDNILIAGFIINGNADKKVILLAKGPSITSGGTPVPGRMANPTLELHDGNGALMTSNDDWKDSPERTQIETSGFAPSDDRESAILRTFSPGVYTGVLTGKDNSTGIALIEVYDLDSNMDSLLANISSRGRVDTGDNVMIGGFIAGNQSGHTEVLVRGIGPSLEGKVPNPLADPILELHDSNGATLETNDNWKDSPNRAQIEATGIPPTHDLESAIIRLVAPAGYTAILRGKTGSGNAVVEIYNIR